MEVDRSVRGYRQYREFSIERDAQDLKILNRKMDSITYPLMLLLLSGCGLHVAYETVVGGGDPAVVLSAGIAAVCGYRMLEYRNLKRQAETLERKYESSGVRLSDHF